MRSGFWTLHSKRFSKWSKILLPYRQLRYYPPQFVLRNPVLEGVYSAVASGRKVAVVVANLLNIKELPQQLDAEDYRACLLELKTAFKEILEASEYNKEILVVHDYYTDGISIFLKINDARQSVPHIESFIRTVMPKVESRLAKRYPYCDFSFEVGYMFVEKQNDSTQDAIYKAHQQAIAMAEKRVQSKYIESILEMREIIQKQNITLLAQPIIDLSTHEVKAWEILTRGPKGTSLESPLPLFSVARQTNMAFDLEMLILEKALQLTEETGCKQEIFINFTPLTLGSQRFMKNVSKVLKEHPAVLPSQIIFEITERDSIEGLHFFKENISALRKMGFRIAVDDTGAGYASLHTISEILPDIIKIDRSVIQDIDTNRVKESMLKGLLLIARETGSLVVAEGIEKKEEAEVLSRNSVDLVQGYYYARPGTLETARIAL
ncbi:EAL domain-containing protein [Metabacillus sp. GX 13764]|uniref:EAL domain-containing protein n=1 Tax=Metabacillus kandeliae TaxID=2900151 RepID=UPI001E5C08C2|nr:EAL domain-containing protein [Metabacillus kandeliae]MCD7036260.1 EAL domain-containing protein [Metabacillus kandeliae]